MRSAPLFTTLPSARSSFLRTLSLALVCTASVSSAFSSTALAVAGDGDDDGVADAADTFPCSADFSSVSFVPGENQLATLAIEDQWPSLGDFDFNDLLLDYNFEIYRDGSNRVRQLRASFSPRAMGALFQNGAALRLPIPSSTAGVSITRNVGSTGAVTVSPRAGESTLVVDIANDVRAELFANAAGVINTDDAVNAVQGKSVELIFTFAASSNITLNNVDAPFDVFLYRTADYSHQIHRSQFAGSDQMRQDLFGTLDDGSNAANNRFFVNKSGVPYILELPTTAPHPKEGRRIETLFPRIVDFAASGGSTNQNFFSTDVGIGNAYNRALSTISISAISGIRDTTCTRPDGASALSAGQSCKSLLNDGVNRGNTTYFIDPDGTGPTAPFEVFCDMTTAGGGWTLVATVVNRSFFAGTVCNTVCGSTPATSCTEAPYTSLSTAGSIATRTTSDFKSSAYSLLPFNQMLFSDSLGRFAAYQVSASNQSSVRSWFPAGQRFHRGNGTEAHTGNFNFLPFATNLANSDNRCSTLRVSFNVEDSDTAVGAQCHSTVVGPTWSGGYNDPCFWDDGGVPWVNGAFGQNLSASTFRTWFVR